MIYKVQNSTVFDRGQPKGIDQTHCRFKPKHSLCNNRNSEENSVI